jgi:hypothetical protein
MDVESLEKSGEVRLKDEVLMICRVGRALTGSLCLSFVVPLWSCFEHHSSGKDCQTCPYEQIQQWFSNLIFLYLTAALDIVDQLFIEIQLSSSPSIRILLIIIYLSNHFTLSVFVCVFGCF